MTAGKISLDRWVREEKERLDKFASWYLAQRKEDCAENWPLLNKTSEWDEQYRLCDGAL